LLGEGASIDEANDSADDSATTAGLEEVSSPQTGTAQQSLAERYGTAVNTERVTRVRLILRRTAIVSAVVSVSATLSLFILLIPGVADSLVLAPDPNELFGVLWVFAGPFLIVVALSALAWRPLISPLDRAPIVKRVLTIVGVGGLYSLVSVALVFVLIFAGFFIATLVAGASSNATALQPSTEHAHTRPAISW